MKLDYKKTIWVGFAFLIICMFWQVYDTVLARILVNSFGLNQTWSGLVLAIDNIVALFLIPFFGVISDKTRSKYGRRTPFIVVGTVVAAIVFIFVGLFTNLQDNKIKEGHIEEVKTVLVIDDADDIKDGYVLGEDYVYVLPGTAYPVLVEKRDEKITFKEAIERIFSRTEKEYEFSSDPAEASEKIYKYGINYYKYKTDAADVRSLDSQTIRNDNIGYFIGFMIILFVVLIAMGAFRSPAVSLMPDVTPKPLRSKANAIINLTGTVGGLIALGFLKITDTDYGNHIWTFIVLAVLMIVFLGLFIWKVKEPKLVDQRIKTEKEYNILETETKEEVKDDNKVERMDKDVRKSFILILLSIVLWFFAYNGATSKFSVYASNVLDTGYSLPLMVAQGAAVISYIPIGMLATKVGRKKTILLGIIILFSAFLLGCFMNEKTAFLTYVTMAIAGIGWATINVNSFPMIVEMCKGSDVGRYTGYYYTASMAAQIATPVISGMLMDVLGMKVLFPYCCVFAALAFATMIFVKHGDAKPVPQDKLEALAGAEDD